MTTTTLMDLPDETIQIIVEYVGGVYDTVDVRDLVKLYKVNKRFYHYSNYYITQYINNTVYHYPPRSLPYKCLFGINNNTLLHYQLWNLTSPINLEISVGPDNLYVYTDKNRQYNKETSEKLLKVLYDVFPGHMKIIHKTIKLSPNPFPLFEEFIYNYLGI